MGDGMDTALAAGGLGFAPRLPSREPAALESGASLQVRPDAWALPILWATHSGRPASGDQARPLW